MASEIIVAILSLAGTLIGTFAGILASTKLTTYRIEQLEKKVEKHNSVIERTALLEQDSKVIWHEIHELKEETKYHENLSES